VLQYSKGVKARVAGTNGVLSEDLDRGENKRLLPGISGGGVKRELSR